MKKAFPTISSACLLLFLSSCNQIKPINVSIQYFVADECVGMGYISGKTRQNPYYGEYTSQVIAYSNNGYKFKTWSDGYQYQNRIDLASSSVLYYAYFEAL